VIDWSICSTGVHNCRTRFRRDLNPAFVAETNERCPGVWLAKGNAGMARSAARVAAHYNEQERDLLDVVIDAAHEAGMQVFGNVRLNHGNCSNWLAGVPGRQHDGGQRRDFRDAVFHDYLLALYTDLLAKGVDGISLDFERKAPFFPDDVPLEERAEACTAFCRRARALTGKPILARVSHEGTKGEAQGQDPERWTAEGLLDIVVPATHNHEPDRLDWSFGRFTAAAAESPRPCRVWPQIWPTPAPWSEREGNLHSMGAIRRRVSEIRAQGADGVYFFNFCCFGSGSELYGGLFRGLGEGDRFSPEGVARARSERNCTGRAES
jgi:hypothetical protein